MDTVLNSEGLLSMICENISSKDLKNFASAVQCIRVNLDEMKHVHSQNHEMLTGSFELLKRHSIASKFRVMYSEFPQRFIYSLPYLQLTTPSCDYMDNLSSDVLGGNVAVCGKDYAGRPFIASRMAWGDEYGTSVIHARYSHNLSSFPRTGGDRSIYSEGLGVTLIYEEIAKICANDFITHVAHVGSSWNRIRRDPN